MGSTSRPGAEPDPRFTAAAETLARELADLRQQIEQARAVLGRLQGSATAEPPPACYAAPELLAANQQLVVAALRAQTDADAATEALDKVSRAADIDTLTDLPNRAALLERFKYAIAIAGRTGTQLALLFVDLDNFKQINDTLGHAVGDQVLKVAAKRLASAVRGSDMVSRHGGDEFLVLLTEVAHPSDVVQIAAKLNVALALPTRVGERVLRLTASIGISLFPGDGEDAATLIDRADSAMYRAKNGREGFAFYGRYPASSPGDEPRALAAPHYPLADVRGSLADQARRHARLRDANEKLVVAALSSQRLQGAAEEAHRRQTHFLAVLAHELRGPLMPMQHAATLLRHTPLDESVLPRIQGMIERQVAHMARLVGDLLDVSRVSTGKLRIERHAVDLVRILDEAVDACRPAMDLRLQRFTAQIPAGPLEFEGDPVRLWQILRNLLDNASKYTAEGGRIGIVVEVIETSIVMTVSDSGIGMSAESLSMVFEPFVQDTRAIEFNRSGLGIGLTVVRELIQAHGGSIVASSAGIGRGSEFIVTLPRNGAMPEVAGASAATG